MTCNAEEHWIDEAQLHDGRTIDVQRSVAFHYGGGELSEALKQRPDQYDITANDPDTGKVVRWSGERTFEPILLDFLGKTPYVVAVASSIFSNLKQYGCPEIPYIFFKQNENNGRWTQISGTEFPHQLLVANLSFRYDGFNIKDGKRQTRQDIEKFNQNAEQKSGGYTSRAIPTDFASWKTDSKNWFKNTHYHDGCRSLVPSNKDSTHPQSKGQPSQNVNLEVLDTKVYDPVLVIKGQTNWDALTWDENQNTKCQALMKQVNPIESPELRGWLLFVNDPTGRKKALPTGDMLCNTNAIWFLDYGAEPGRLVLTKFTITGDFLYRISFIKPDEPRSLFGSGIGGFLVTPTFRSKDGYLYFEWWNSEHSGEDNQVKRSLKVRLQEPLSKST